MGREGAGFFGIDDVIGNRGDLGGEFRAGGQAAEGLDAHSKTESGGLGG
jgi:hypothetical protein